MEDLAFYYILSKGTRLWRGNPFDFSASICSNLPKKYFKNKILTPLKVSDQKHVNYLMFVILSLYTFVPNFKSFGGTIFELSMTSYVSLRSAIPHINLNIS